MGELFYNITKWGFLIVLIIVGASLYSINFYLSLILIFIGIILGLYIIRKEYSLKERKQSFEIAKFNLSNPSTSPNS